MFIVQSAGGCSIPKALQGQVVQGFEQPEVVGNVAVNCRDVGLEGLQRCIPMELLWEGFCASLSWRRCSPGSTNISLSANEKAEILLFPLNQPREGTLGFQNRTFLSDFLKNLTYSFPGLFLSLRREGKWNHLLLLIFKYLLFFRNIQDFALKRAFASSLCSFLFFILLNII